LGTFGDHHQFLLARMLPGSTPSALTSPLSTPTAAAVIIAEIGLDTVGCPRLHI
jgi:hypothetical protein